jgi:type II secretion system protein G
MGAALAPAVAAILMLACRGIDDTPESQVARTRTNLEMVGRSLIQFKEETGHYPTVAQGLEALTDEHRRGSNLLRALPKDSWGKPFVYRVSVESNGESFLLYSVGPNGVDDGGSGDDISYRTEQMRKELSSDTRER